MFDVSVDLWILFPVCMIIPLSYLLESDGFLDSGAGGDDGLVILSSKIRSFGVLRCFVRESYLWFLRSGIGSWRWF